MESRMRVCPACRRLIVGVISRRALDPLVAAPGTSTRLHWPTMNGKLFLIYWDTWKMYVSILFFFSFPYFATSCCSLFLWCREGVYRHQLLTSLIFGFNSEAKPISFQANPFDRLVL